MTDVARGRIETTHPTTYPNAHEIADEHRDLADAALEVLLDSSLEPIVDMVFAHRDGAYEVMSSEGRLRFTSDAGVVSVIEEQGANPIGNQATDAFSPLEAELAHKHPHRRDNAYPNAYEQIVQLFDAPAAPDLCVLHSSQHNWEDQGGHIGEHGSIGAVQARAPWVIAGRGVANLGVVPRAARLVDVAPTIASLLGCAPYPEGQFPDGRFLSRQDGVVRDDVLVGSERPRHVVGFLFDGANPNVLYSMAASGEAPNVARLIEMGTAFGHGAMAGLPTVTLANHTSILTGAYPGHHGILNNAWYDRVARQQVITNSPATWHTAMNHVRPGTDSIHSAVLRTWPDEFTASVNEPCDVDAPYSTFGFFRRGENPGIPPSPEGLPHVTERFVRPSKDYSWSSVVDHMAIEQAVGIWSGRYRDESYPLPRFMWVNFTLTDAAMHECGPHSEMAAASVRDSDARIGEVLAAVERAGVFDDTAFVLVADHGMEENDPACQGDWDVSLRAAGLQIRDEAYGFLYLGVES
jgi:phosphonoacetate hydrolase